MIPGLWGTTAPNADDRHQDSPPAAPALPCGDGFFGRPPAGPPRPSPAEQRRRLVEAGDHRALLEQLDGRPALLLDRGEVWADVRRAIEARQAADPDGFGVALLDEILGEGAYLRLRLARPIRRRLDAWDRDTATHGTTDEPPLDELELDRLMALEAHLARLVEARSAARRRRELADRRGRPAPRVVEIKTEEHRRWDSNPYRPPSDAETSAEPDDLDPSLLHRNPFGSRAASGPGRRPGGRADRIGPDAARERRWEAIAKKLADAEPWLGRQGTLVAKPDGPRTRWVVRYVARDGRRRVHRSIYITTGDPELLRRAGPSWRPSGPRPACSRRWGRWAAGSGWPDGPSGPSAEHGR